MTARSRFLRWAAVIGVPLSQLGHVVAYVAHYGSHGILLQEEGVHAYFPEVVRFSAGTIGLLMLAALVVVGLGRLLLGRGLGMTQSGGQRMTELLMVSAAVQLDTYLVQEILEALASHQTLTFGLLLSILGWGLAGQLPVALVAALALSWLSVRLDSATAGLRSLWQLCVTLRVLARAAAIAVQLPMAPTVPHTGNGTALRHVLIRRGPPAGALAPG